MQHDRGAHWTLRGEEGPTMDDEYDITIDELDEATCWRLAARAGFGRIGFVLDDEIMVHPVNFAVTDGQVVFRTSGDTRLARAGNGSRVAFETDHIDRAAESGWSVMIRGRLWDVTDRPETANWHRLLVRPWAPPPREVWMTIQPSAVTGRMIHRQRHLLASARVPYMPPD
jgi:uncharacterized protein